MVKLSLVAGMIWCLLLVPKAWRGPRLCPRAPLLKGLPNLPFEAELHTVLLILLSGIAVSPRPGWLVVAWVGIAAVSCLYDYTRLLPWFYQYSFLLMAEAFSPEATEIGCLINLSIYFWSGVLKANRYFLTTGFASLVAPLLQNLPPRWHPLILGLAPWAPVVEGGLGLGLLFPATRKLSVLLALAMHGFILVCFSRLGKSTHRTIWPWNISMGLTTLLLFWPAQTLTPQAILWGQGGWFHLLVLGLFTILPCLGLFNRLETNFSHGYMTGRHILGYLHLSQRFYRRLPKAIQEECIRVGPVFVLDLGNWYVKELAMNPPQVKRLLIDIARDFERYGPEVDDISLTLTGMPGIFSKQLPQEVIPWLKLFPEKRNPRRRHLGKLRASQIRRRD